MKNKAFSITIFAFVLFTIAIFSSCKKDDSGPAPQVPYTPIATKYVSYIYRLNANVLVPKWVNYLTTYNNQNKEITFKEFNSDSTVIAISRYTYSATNVIISDSSGSVGAKPPVRKFTLNADGTILKLEFCDTLNAIPDYYISFEYNVAKELIKQTYKNGLTNEVDYYLSFEYNNGNVSKIKKYETTPSGIEYLDTEYRYLYDNKANYLFYSLAPKYDAYSISRNNVTQEAIYTGTQQNLEKKIYYTFEYNSLDYPIKRTKSESTNPNVQIMHEIAYK